MNYAITYNDQMLLVDLRAIADSRIPSITSYQYTVKPGSQNYVLFKSKGANGGMSSFV